MMDNSEFLKHFSSVNFSGGVPEILIQKLAGFVVGFPLEICNNVYTLLTKIMLPLAFRKFHGKYDSDRLPGTPLLISF